MKGIMQLACCRNFREQWNFAGFDDYALACCAVMIYQLLTPSKIL
jgi:hypothetical protein